ncbi:hypothetical protein OG555_18875 [Kribbella sp. NBC_01484]|uniref:amino acid kinase family protein n=1 Tax=Kribbella sp. NBC_01484 TaxID=2903579 RepID=UPI002E31A471|nr:hypothetical protein [Kribbella sp. NBC_01484]
MATLVLKVSGVAFEDRPDLHGGQEDYARRLAASISELTAAGHNIALTIGGGSLARRSIDRARRLGLEPVRASYLGADAGLMNARIAIAALRGGGIPCSAEPITAFDAAAEAMRSGLTPVLFGYWHGLTSDAVAALFASYIAADLVVKLSQIDGVYPSDHEAKSGTNRHSCLPHRELAHLALEFDSRTPGASFVLDVVAAKSLADTKIPLLIDHWRHLNTLKSAIERAHSASFEEESGTIVRSD